MRRIYLDYAATTPVSPEVLRDMLPYFSETFGNADSPHSFGRDAADALDRARRRIAEIAGARHTEIYFTSGGTEANNWAVKGAFKEGVKRGRNRIITSVIEHSSVLSAVSSCGAAVTYLPVGADGTVDPESLELAMDGDVALVSVMAVNNETGAVQPTERLAEIARRGGALFHTDAVQAACFGISRYAAVSDLVTLSAHKLYGPKGIGMLYVRRGTRIGKLIEGGEQERDMRGGTVNVPAAVGFASALSAYDAAREEENERLRALRDIFVSRVLGSGIGAVVNGGERSAPGIVNLRVRGIDDDSLLHMLDLEGVACSAGAACSSGSAEPSHVLLAMGLTESEARSSVRVSMGRSTTESDVSEAAERFVRAAERIISGRKKQ